MLRESEGRILLRFSKSVDSIDSNMVELLAMREGLICFPAFSWVHTHKLILESDSANAIGWASDPNSVPWKMAVCRNHIVNFSKRISGVQFCHILREANNLDDKLAKEGVNRTEALLELT